MNRAAAKSKSKSAGPDRRKIIIWATIAVVVIGVIVAVSRASYVPTAATKALGTSTIKVGETAPDFAVQTNAGPFELKSVSTPVLLEVFATWCPHCQRETAILNDVAGKYQGKIAMISVSGDAFDMTHTGPETQTDVNTFAQKYGVRYPIAFDPDLKVAQQYLQTGFPTIVMIDANKKITFMKDGEVPEKDIVKAIKAVLPAKPQV
jgi:thiol-disulfide isomerase/thioredoxin